MCLKVLFPNWNAILSLEAMAHPVSHVPSISLMLKLIGDQGNKPSPFSGVSITVNRNTINGYIYYSIIIGAFQFFSSTPMNLQYLANTRIGVKVLGMFDCNFCYDGSFIYVILYLTCYC